ncbi:TonB-dependent receptor [Litorivivens sp.]|uniref:TonB-dependent receptor n=2 Tax=Litorivivens sp. TaxID=2020868 RepID=UPI00356795E9
MNALLSPRLLIALPMLYLSSAPWAQSESTSRGPVIEEVFVTAQRKAEQIQDVPISMSALDGEFLRDQGISDLQDVALYVPNVRVDFAGNYIQPRVRGIATNTVVNRGLALPVGIVIDEVPYSRADYFAAGLFDLQRVEVLRGPQGQLFGANTTVGLMNITTRDPSEETMLDLSAEGGEYERRRYEAALGGPLIADRMNARIAWLKEEYGNYMKNTTALTNPEADEGFGERSRESWRLKLAFPDVWGGDIMLSYQHDDSHFGGSPREIVFGHERWEEQLRAADPNVDVTPDNLIGSVDSPNYRDAETDTLALKGSFYLGEWTINLIAGYSELESITFADSDNSPLPANTVEIDEASKQDTAEIRLGSPNLDGFLGLDSLFGLPLGNSDFTAGVFYQRRDQKPTNAITRLNAPLTVTLTGLSSLPGFFPIPGVLPPDKWESFTANFEQEAREQAVFGQFNWYFLDRWTLFAGLRVSEIRKDAVWVQTIESEDGACCIIENLVSSFNGAESNTEQYRAPKVGLKFDWTDDVNFYATWAEGFQPGGFNNFSNSDSVEARTVEPAYVDAWEAGSKMRLLDGAAELNIGVFLMNMKDFQLFTTANEDGGFIPIAQVTNVGELEVKGLELDFTWLPNHWLSLRGSLGYNDSEYIDFPIATCFTDNANSDGDDEARCDLTGQQLTQAPEWEASFTPSIHLPMARLTNVALFRNLDLRAGLGVQFTDERFLHESNDPRHIQPAYTLVSASLGIHHATANWSIGVRVENATDERYANTGIEAIPAAGLGVRAPNPPRTVIGSFRWSF